MRNVTLRQMRVFTAVARHGSFTRAARELHLSQPAVSQQIKLLEQEAGLPLFEHIGRTIHVTAAGQELLRYATQVTELLREAAETLAAMAFRLPAAGDLSAAPGMPAMTSWIQSTS